MHRNWRFPIQFLPLTNNRFIQKYEQSLEQKKKKLTQLV